MKKGISLLLAAVLAMSLFTACSERYTEVLTIDDTQIKAGTYLICQLEAFAEASQKVSDKKKDILKQTIEEKPVKEWLQARTFELCRRYVYTEKQFATLSLQIEEAKKAELDKQVESDWKESKNYYESNGVSFSSFTDYYYNNYKLQAVFDSIYAEDGEKAVSDEQAKAFLNENYARMEYLVIPKVSVVDYTVLSGDKAKEVADIADKLAAALNENPDNKAASITLHLQQAYKIAGNAEMDFTEPESYITPEYVEKENQNYSAEFTKSLFEAEQATFKVQDMDSYLMIYRKIANIQDEAAFEALRPSIVSEMNTSAFDADVKAAYDAYTLTEVSGAVKHYNVKNIKAAK